MVSTPQRTRDLSTKRGETRGVAKERASFKGAPALREATLVLKRGFRFRAGIEGRISVLRRSYGLGRCLEHGEEGMGRWVGWGILVHNLAKISEAQAARAAA